MKKKNALFAKFSEQMPTNMAVIGKGMKLAADKFGDQPGDIKKNFSSYVVKSHDEIYRIYQDNEKDAGEKVIAQFVKENVGKPFLRELDSFFLSLTQSRKARAGRAFQEIIKVLFKRLNYPFDENRVINGKPDFVMPSEDHFRKDPVDCVVFAIKRTLRERWREIVAEGAKTARFFLATMDEDLTGTMLKDAHDRKIYVVVPKQLKSDIDHYRTGRNVISFEDFFEDHLDPAMKRWKKREII